MVNHQIVRRGTKRTIHGKHNTVSHGHNFRATRSGKIYPKMDPAGRAIKVITLIISINGVTVSLLSLSQILSLEMVSRRTDISHKK